MSKLLDDLIKQSRLVATSSSLDVRTWSEYEWRPKNVMRRRLTGFAGLLLTAFFAAMGGFHHHELPKPTHEHAGFCSQTSIGISIESCALCRASHTAARLAAIPATTGELNRTSYRVFAVVPAPRSIGRSLLSDPRAPPAA